jgi:hypothetical protein
MTLGLTNMKHTLLTSFAFLMLAVACGTAAPSSNRLVLARQLADISQEDLYREFSACISSYHAGAEPFIEIIRDEAKGLVPMIKEKMSVIFATEFSEDELRYLVKVQQHPAVKRFAALTPKMRDQMSEALDQHLKAHPDIQKRMVERIMKQQRIMRQQEESQPIGAP